VPTVCDGKPVIILPGFTTSCDVNFHDLIMRATQNGGLAAASDARTAKGRFALKRAWPHGIRDGVVVEGAPRV